MYSSFHTQRSLLRRRMHTVIALLHFKPCNNGVRASTMLGSMLASILHSSAIGAGNMKTHYIIREAIIHVRKILHLIRDRGIMFVLRLLLGTIFGYYYYRIFKSHPTFNFHQRHYTYFYHPYNVTWMSERAVEIPIIHDAIECNMGKKILEVGNVLNHYFRIDHDVVDKYEMDRNVINQDVVDFRPKERYDLIVSISTLEHIGWDEHLLYHKQEPHKIKCALDNLKKYLAPNGEIIMTYPVGYNPNLDRLTDNDELKWSKLLCMKRVSADNVWVERKWHDVKCAQYDDPFISANGLVIAYFKKPNNYRKRNSVWS